MWFKTAKTCGALHKCYKTHFTEAYDKSYVGVGSAESSGSGENLQCCLWSIPGATTVLAAGDAHI